MTSLRISAADPGSVRIRRRILYRWLAATAGVGALVVGVFVAMPAFAADSTWNAVSAGTSHTCGIKTDTTAWCWGANNAGQLGTGDNVDYTTPAPVLNGGTGWISISAGFDFTCGVRVKTRLCWGANASGQLGLGDHDNRNVPTARSGEIFVWKQVDAGQRHACGLFASGGMMCWGSNMFGQLGSGTTTNRAVPGSIVGGGQWLSVSAGSYHTCAVKSNNYRYCWGINDAHQLGLVEVGTSAQLTPYHDSADGKYVSVDSGDGTTCFISITNALGCYGVNTYGNAGVGTTTPVDAMVSRAQWWATSSGGYHACAIDDSGLLWCWGRNSAGQLGLGDNTDRTVPVRQLRQTNEQYVDVSAGFNHTCALRESGHLVCWGYNAQGQLGIGTTNHVNTPTLVS